MSYKKLKKKKENHREFKINNIYNSVVNTERGRCVVQTTIPMGRGTEVVTIKFSSATFYSVVHDSR